MKQTITTYTVLFFLAFLCINVNHSNAQGLVDYKKNADRFYAANDYYSAAIYYEKYIGKSKNDNNAISVPYTIQKKGRLSSKKDNSNQLKYLDISFRIGECYRQLHNYSEAEKWYTAPAKNSEFILAKLWLAICEKANNHFELANNHFTDFLKSYHLEDIYKKTANFELASLSFSVQQLRKNDSFLFKINKLPLNSNSADYAASIQGNNFIFTSARKDTNEIKKNKNEFRNRLYQVDSLNSENVLPITFSTMNDYEYGTSTFNADGTVLFFTAWKKTEGKNIASIYSVQKTGINWNEPKILNSNVNQSGYSSQQPFVTDDGKYLFFSSDKPGGFGKFDLYIAPLNSTDAGVSNNLGKIINTDQDEQSPFFQSNTQTLVFASNGKVGMGGFDLFTSRGNVINNTWAETENMGHPINTTKDELYFYSASKNKLFKQAFISSDRLSDCCLQLFSVEKTYPKYINGTVYDCSNNQPLSNASITLLQEKEPKSIQKYSDTTGKFLFEINEFTSLKVVATKNEYQSANLNFTPVGNDAIDTINMELLCLIPIVKDTPVKIVDTLRKRSKLITALFDFAKADISVETKQVLDTLAAIMNRETKLGIEINGFTDNIGTKNYNVQLSKKRAEVCKKYLIENGIKESRILVTGNGACCPIEPETDANGKDNEAARRTNRRVEFKLNLLYL